MTNEGMNSDLLMQYIDQLKIDPAALPPGELDQKSVEFARDLVRSQHRRPAPSARNRMWEAALSQAAEARPTQTDAPMLKIIPLPGKAASEDSESLQLARRQTKRRRAYPITAVASVMIAVLIMTLLATMDRTQSIEEPEQVGGGTAVAMNEQPGFMPVVMASGPIEPGTLIEADMLTTVMWPEDMPLPGPVYSDVEEVVGKYCRGETSDFMPLLDFNMTDDTPISFEMPARIENDL